MLEDKINYKKILITSIFFIFSSFIFSIVFYIVQTQIFTFKSTHYLYSIVVYYSFLFVVSLFSIFFLVNEIGRDCSFKRLFKITFISLIVVMPAIHFLITSLNFLMNIEIYQYNTLKIFVELFLVLFSFVFIFVPAFLINGFNIKESFKYNWTYIRDIKHFLYQILILIPIIFLFQGSQVFWYLCSWLNLFYEPIFLIGFSVVQTIVLIFSLKLYIYFYKQIEIVV